MTNRPPAPLSHLNLVEFIAPTVCVIGAIWMILR